MKYGIIFFFKEVNNILTKINFLILFIVKFYVKTSTKTAHVEVQT